MQNDPGFIANGSWHVVGDSGGCSTEGPQLASYSGHWDHRIIER